MIRHHYTLEHIVNECRRELVGLYISDCFTQEKNILMIECTAEKHEIWLECWLDTYNGSFFLKKDFARARHNAKDCFSAIVGQQIRDIQIYDHDRIIAIHTTSYILYFLLFSGGRAEIILCDIHAMPIAQFLSIHNFSYKNIENLLTPNNSTFRLHKYVSVKNVEEHLQLFTNDVNIEENTKEIINKALPEIGKYYCQHIEQKFRHLSHGDTDKVAVLAKLIVEIYYSLKSSEEYFCLKLDSTYIFSLIPLDGFSIVFKSSSISEVIRRTVSLRRKAQREYEIIHTLRNTLEKKAQRAQRTLTLLEKEDAALQKTENFKLWADILFSQENGRIKPDEKEFITSNWDGDIIHIPVSTEKTLIENAELYYVKLRNAHQSAKIRQQRIPIYEKELATLKGWIATLNNNPDLATLEELYQKVFKTSTKKMNSIQEQSPKFRVFPLDNGFTLYVGKNAANNDELTMRFAKPNDLWFHARGVSGSHAVLRHNGKEKPTKNIIEKAAAIAAYYSSARNASYTPVAYTEKKYIRKPKGAHPGAVVMEREKVVMVSPGLPEGHTEKE